MIRLKLLKSAIVLSIIFAILISLCSCSLFDNSATQMVFSFDTNEPSNYSSDSKILYINEDIEKLELNAELKTDSEDVTVQVIDFNDEIIWSENYNNNSNFKIELFDLKSESEYLLKVEARTSKNLKLTVTSETKLVKNKEKSDKPNKYNVGN